MASTINASSTANGIVSTADASGILNIQSNGVNTNAQAWVNFNGNGVGTIRASYNVSSVTRNSTGNYTVNYTNAFSDVNYCVTLALQPTSGSPAYRQVGLTTSGTYSTTATQLTCCDGAATFTDAQIYCLAAFR